MTPEELERCAALDRRDRARRGRCRASRRRAPDPRGDRLDLRRLVRRSLRTGGDPRRAAASRAQGRPAQARRPLRRLRLDGRILARAPALPARCRRERARCGGVRIRHAADAAHARPRRREPEAALARATVGGGRLGERDADRRSLKELNDIYGRRGLYARRGRRDRLRRLGARRSRRSLAREMATLARTAYAVVWVNPLKGNPEYQPLAGGMRVRAALRRPIPPRP